ncbi:MAG: flagellar biosynthesis protein FliQ [Sulfuricurvum sp.]|jgi:flagellar biosynthetic protein FliQ|uniref:flagellar biosynthesis protein FliQ n=1 Tax=Sulfuricurvum sp. TaxID=2025608 RepID=UPI0025EE62F3|nr:flagellar biosynthesis protein FliQ [Sulfuricurvum sp.]MCK9371880.1 flagellar biosynthesis protein FliQ [Sulfuricurvum sp.]
MLEEELVGLGVETFKLAMLLALPSLLVGMFLGLAVSIFQATTQINEQTLSFIPKIVGIVIVIVLTMPWMMSEMEDFTIRMFNLIPTFMQ